MRHSRSWVDITYLDVICRSHTKGLAKYETEFEINVPTHLVHYIKILIFYDKLFQLFEF